MKVTRVAVSDEESSAKKKCIQMYQNEVGAFVRTSHAFLQGVAKLVAIPTSFGDNLAVVMEYCGP